MDDRFGARPNPEPSIIALVKHGFTRKQRVALARRDDRLVDQLLRDYSADDRAKILALCDAFLAKHGTWEEKHGKMR